MEWLYTLVSLGILIVSECQGQVSISADAISGREVYVSWDSMGEGELEDFRLSYTTLKDEPWRLLSFFPGIRGFRVMDLEPGTLYYFRAQGHLGDEMVTAVTHVKTPPYADSRTPVNLTSEAVPGGVKMKWTASDSTDILGYVVSVVEVDDDNVARGPTLKQSVFGTPELVLDELTTGSRYKVHVQFRTRYGVGLHSQPFFIGEKLPVTPKITVNPQTKKVVIGGSVAFTCGAIADPTPSVTWRRSGRRINTSKKRFSEVEKDGITTLTIENVAKGDKGPYVCIIDNKVGKKAKAKAVLKVLLASSKAYPKLNIQPESGEFGAGNNVTLGCQGSGKGKLHYTWYKDSTLVPDTRRYMLYPSGNLTIYNVNVNDGGTYSCELKNRAGALMSQKALIEITDKKASSPPVFRETQLVHRVGYGGAVNLTCQADGHPEPEVKWHLDNGDTTTNTRKGAFTLALTNIRASGSYKCVATSGKYSIKQNYEVITELPALPEPVIHVARRLDGGAGFVRWRVGKKGDTLPGVQGFVVTYTPVDSSNRVIDAEKQSNEHLATERKDLMPYIKGGFGYNVVVRAIGQSGLGPPSQPAFIPAVGQPEITTPPEPLTVQAGGIAIFHCEASGKPSPLLYWSHGGNRINYDDSRLKVTLHGNHTTLRIDNVEQRDAGTYTCTAANNILRLSVSKQTVLQVLPRDEIPEGFPMIVRGPRMLNDSGQHFLECMVEDDIEANITWYKNSFQVQQSPRVQIEGGRLYFNSLSRTDDGQYICLASNGVGQAFSPPHTVSKKRGPSVKYVRVVPGSNVNLTCVGVGMAFPRVRWTYRGEDIENGESPILQVVDIRESRNYTCVAVTDTGEMHATFVILVSGKPRVAQGKPVIVADTSRVEVQSGLGLNLTCATGGVPVLYFKWLADGEVIFQDNRGENINSSVLYLTNVRYDKNYTCVAVGARENAEVIFQVVVVGGENNPNKPIIIHHPQNMYAEKGNPATLDCVAEGDPPPIVTWYKDGKPIQTTRDNPNSNKIVLHGGKLFFLKIIHNEDYSDSGVYYCNATNVFGSTISDYATMQIASVPRITTVMKPISMKRGSDVTLRCTAVGPPEPVVSWRQYNRDVAKVEPRAGTSVLVLRNVQRSVNYTCVAHNILGRTQQVFPVLVGQKSSDDVEKVKEIKVVPGSFLNLTCVSDSPATTIYSWATDDQDIPASSNVLALNNVQQSTNYTCTARTPDKTSKATFMIIMEAEHSLVIGGTEFVDEGGPLSLACNASGEYSDVADLQWFKDGQMLDQESHPEMNIVKTRSLKQNLLTSRLTIIRSSMQDTGVYLCRTTDSSEYRSIDVLVLKSELVPHSKTVRITRGEYMNLTCLTPEAENNMYVWKKNGAYVKGLTRPFVVVEAVQESANYTCISQGVSVASKATFNVIVEGRQGVTISGPDHVQVGGDMVFTCNATGRSEPPDEIIWLKGGDVLEQSRHIMTAMDTVESDEMMLQGRLEISEVTPVDSGLYVCQSSTGHSATYKVTVEEAPLHKGQHGTTITLPPHNKNVEEGAPVRFYCEAQGPESLTVHWEKAGRRVSSKGRFTVSGTARSSILEIDPVIRGQDDQVVCVADDGVGPTKSHFANINVYDHTSMPFDFPAITEHPEMRAVEKGSTTSFQCEALGTRNATIIWYKDKLPVATSGRLTVIPGDQNSQLRISGVEQADDAIYQCSVENRAGIAYSKMANLYVRGRQYPPQFTRPFETKRVRAGDDVTLVCTAVGSPIPRVRWLLDGRAVNADLAPKGRDVIRLKNVRVSLDYVCSADNLLGQIEHTTRVVVEDPDAVPVAPDKPEVSGVGSRKVTVTWEDANKEGISTITVYVVHVRECSADWETQINRDVIVGGTSTKVSITGLTPGTCYQVRLTAKNGQGAGPYGRPSQRFYTRKEELRDPPRNVQARLISADSGLVSWSDPPSLTDVENLQEYRVLYSITPTVPLEYWKSQSVPRGQNSAILRALSQYATYTIRIQAVYSAEQRVESDPVELFVKDPGRDDLKLTISNLEGEILSPSSVKLFWKNPVSIEPTEGYELYIEDTEGYNEQIRVSGKANSYVVSGLVPGGEYIIRIARRTRFGEGPKTDAISLMLPTFVLESPTITELAAVNSSTISINWKPPPSSPQSDVLIQAYVVTVDNQRRRENRRVTVGSHHHNVTVGGLTPDTQYSVRVTAVTEQGDGPSSDPKSVTTTSRATQAPILEEVAGVNETALFIRWRPSPFANDLNIQGYFVYIEKVKLGPWDTTVRYIMDVRPGTKYDIVMDNLLPGTKFQVEVAWYTPKGEGPRSAPLTGSTKGSATTTPVPDNVPLSPYLEEVSALNATSLLITWWPPDEEIAGAEIKGYYVYMERLVGRDWVPESRYQTNIPPEGQMFIIGGLKPRNRYRVTVSAYSDGGEGPKSEQLVVDTHDLGENADPVIRKQSAPVAVPQMPILNEVSAVNTTSVLVKWRPSRADNGANAVNIHGYYLYVEIYDGGSWRSEFKFTTNALPAGQQLIINGLEPDRKYRIRVSGFGPAGEGPQSIPMSTETTANAIRERIEEKPPAARGYCQIYLGMVCSRFLRNKSVYVTSRFAQPNTEEKVVAALAFIANRLSQKCANLAVQTVCYTAFPPCTAVDNVPSPREVCREDCYAMDVGCGDEIAMIRSHPHIGEDILPHCNSFRTSLTSSGGTCVRVRAGDSPDSGASEPGRRQQLPQSPVPSSPQRMAVNPISRSPYRVRLVWLPPQQPNGNITGYEVGWNTDEGDTFSELVPADQLSFETQVLYRGIRYIFEVQALNPNGKSEPIRAMLDIPEGVPGGPPLNLEATSNSSAIQLTWDPPAKDIRNGLIVGYNVKAWLVSSPASEQTFQASQPGLILQNVQSKTAYGFMIAAKTRVGTGPWSGKVETTTT